MTLAVALFACPIVHAQKADPARQANAAYFEAVAHETAGDPDAAKADYQRALRLNPRHAKARYRLGQLKINYDRIIAEGQERKIGSVMIPEFNVDEAEFREALRALAIHIEKQTKEEITPNFIIQDPTSTVAERKITLKMKNIPSGEILNYMLQMAKAKAQFDKHAVVITPR